MGWVLAVYVKAEGRGRICGSALIVPTRVWSTPQRLDITDGMFHEDCFGSEPVLADVYLIPQLYAAERFNISLEACPRIRRVAALAAQHPDTP